MENMVVQGQFRPIPHFGKHVRSGPMSDLASDSREPPSRCILREVGMGIS
jgi:hypothetical protein